MEFLDDAERYYIYTHTHTHTHGGYNENGFSVSVLRPAEQMISRSSFFFAARSRWSCYYTRRTLFFRYVCAATFTRFCQSNARRRKFRAMSGFACARALIARAEWTWCFWQCYPTFESNLSASVSSAGIVAGNYENPINWEQLVEGSFVLCACSNFL